MFPSNQADLSTPVPEPQRNERKVSHARKALRPTPSASPQQWILNNLLISISRPRIQQSFCEDTYLCNHLHHRSQPWFGCKYLLFQEQASHVHPHDNPILFGKAWNWMTISRHGDWASFPIFVHWISHGRKCVLRFPTGSRRICRNTWDRTRGRYIVAAQGWY